MFRLAWVSVVSFGAISLGVSSLLGRLGRGHRKRSLSVGARGRQSCTEHLTDAGALLGVGVRPVHVELDVLVDFAHEVGLCCKNREA